MAVKCKNFDTCGNYKPRIARVKGLCDECAMKKSKLTDLTKVTKRINKFEEYVKKKIENHLKHNKYVTCKECGVIITSKYVPKQNGFNVAHLISKGANPEAYYIQENSIFLCRTHHVQFDNGDSKSMKISEWVKNQKKYVRDNLNYLKSLDHNIYEVHGE